MAQFDLLGRELMGPPAELAGQPQAAVPQQADPQRVGRWGQFLQNIKSDPNLRMALMQAGAAMMRSPQMGENVGDVIGRGFQTGLVTLDTMRQRDISQRERTEDRALEREVKTGQLANDTTRTGAYVKSADAQTRASSAAAEKAEWENSPEYRQLVIKGLQGGLSVQEAEIEARKAAANNQNAQADLHRRTDPNLTGSGGGGGRDTDLQYSVGIIEQELARQFPNMPPAQRKARALAEARKQQGKASGNTEALRAFQVLSGMNPQAMTDPAKQAELWARAQQMAQQGQMIDNARGLERTGSLATKHKGKELVIQYPSGPARAKVVGVATDGSGNILVALPNGATDTVTPDELAAELGE